MQESMIKDIRTCIQQCLNRKIYTIKLIQIGKNIKETCKRVYEQGYKDGFNEGFKWNLTKDKLPNNTADRIVAIYFCEENANGDFFEDTKVKTGYYHNGEWFIEGRPLYFDGDYGEKVIAWADFPTYDD